MVIIEKSNLFNVFDEENNQIYHDATKISISMFWFALISPWPNLYISITHDAPVLFQSIPRWAQIEPIDFNPNIQSELWRCSTCRGSLSRPVKMLLEPQLPDCATDPLIFTWD